MLWLRAAHPLGLPLQVVPGCVLPCGPQGIADTEEARPLLPVGKNDGWLGCLAVCAACLTYP